MFPEVIVLDSLVKLYTAYIVPPTKSKIKQRKKNLTRVTRKKKGKERKEKKRN